MGSLPRGCGHVVVDPLAPCEYPRARDHLVVGFQSVSRDGLYTPGTSCPARTPRRATRDRAGLGGIAEARHRLFHPDVFAIAASTGGPGGYARLPARRTWSSARALRSSVVSACAGDPPDPAPCRFWIRARNVPRAPRWAG